MDTKNSVEKKVEMVSISTSKIRANECPHYFKNDYSDRGEKKDATTATPLLTGRLAHKVIDVYDKALIASNEPSDFELFLKTFNAEWEAQDYIPESEYEDMVDYLTRFAEAHSLDLDNVFGTEIKLALNRDLSVVDYNAPDAWLRMILDRVEYYPKEGLAVITDYKTARYMPSDGQQKRNLQTLVYPFGLFMTNPHIQRIKMVFHFIRYNWRQEFEFTRDDVMGIESKLSSFTERLLKKLNDPNTEWEAITGANCPICRVDCPLTELGVIPIQNKEYATCVAMQIEALKTKAKLLDTALKDYVKVTDESISTNLGVYAWHPSSTIRGLKAAKIAEVALGRGIDLNLCLSPDRKKIEKLDASDRETLLALGKETKGTRYKLIKVAKDGEDDES